MTEYICNEIGCFALFATHYHELTEIEKEIKAIKNLHVDAQVIGKKEKEIERKERYTEGKKKRYERREKRRRRRQNN
jgi:DNA mismatch repair ATPase MutS